MGIGLNSVCMTIEKHVERLYMLLSYWCITSNFTSLQAMADPEEESEIIMHSDLSKDQEDQSMAAAAATSRCSSGFASEFGNAAELRVAVELILSKCFSYLR